MIIKQQPKKKKKRKNTHTKFLTIKKQFTYQRSPQKNKKKIKNINHQIRRQSITLIT